MSVFTDLEIEYMAGQRLGRIATVGADGQPHVVPTSFRYNADEDAIDVAGMRMSQTKKTRAVRRYVAILREAELPVEAVSGPYGGYRAGRGLRLPPLMFSAAEAMGLVMAVLEGHRYAADPGDLVGGALAKIVRSLPERVAG